MTTTANWAGTLGTLSATVDPIVLVLESVAIGDLLMKGSDGWMAEIVMRRAVAVIWCSVSVGAIVAIIAATGVDGPLWVLVVLRWVAVAVLVGAVTVAAACWALTRARASRRS